jgi:secreted Zn-dependent insulinase-like peptidase
VEKLKKAFSKQSERCRFLRHEKFLKVGETMRLHIRIFVFFLALGVLNFVGKLAFAATPMGATQAVAAAKPAKLVVQGTSIIDTPQVYKYLLPNGLRVLILPDHRNPVATVRLRFDAGSNREKFGQTGLAHFFEHMMFRKTKFTDEGHYDRILSAVGGSGNAGTSTDYVVYYSQFPAPALETVMELEAQRVTGVDLQEPFFSTEKGAVISERGLRYDNAPTMRGYEVLNSLLERNTPYEWLTIGFKRDVDGMRISDVQKFFSDYYTPDNAVLSIGGAVEKDTALALVQKYFGVWTGRVASEHAEFPADYLSRDAGKTFVCSEEVSQQDYSVFYPSLRHSIRDSWFSMMLSEALDDHVDGPLSRRMIKAGLVTEFSIAKMTWHARNQHLMVNFEMSRGQEVDKARAMWEKAVAVVLKTPLTPRFRARLTKQIQKSDADNAEKMSSLMEMYEENEFRYNSPFASSKFAKFVSSVSEKEFREWLGSNILGVKPLLVGIVPIGVARPCQELWGKK